MTTRIFLGAIFGALLSSGSAFAAGLVTPMPVVEAPAPGPYDWTGFYLGVFGGVAASQHQVTTTPASTTATFSGDGGFGGVQAGYNFDLSGVVLGVSADIALASVGVTVADGIDNLSSTMDYFGTVEARLGLPMDDLMIYAHGGYAYSHENQNIAEISGATFNEGRSGYVIGLGVDYAINQNVSLETEYGYYNFGAAAVTSIGSTELDEQTSFHALKTGLNYKF